MTKRTALGRPLNWHPRLPHHACEKMSWSGTELPSIMDLRENDSPIFDQGQEGSCTANAGCGCYDYYKWKSGEWALFITSRRFLYWLELAMDGNKGQDAGSSLTTCAEAFAQKGVCLEATWPYGQGDMFTEAPAEAWAQATRFKIASAVQVQQDLMSMQECLAAGNPFIFGISVYESFENSAGGDIPMPGANEQLLGGHALCCVGYEDLSNRFIFRNSWGTQWGDAGYGYIPYEYLTDPNLASDFWSFKV